MGKPNCSKSAPTKTIDSIGSIDCVDEARAPSVLLLAHAARAPFVCGVNVGDLLCGTSIASIESIESIKSIESI